MTCYKMVLGSKYKTNIIGRSSNVCKVLNYLLMYWMSCFIFWSNFVHLLYTFSRLKPNRQRRNETEFSDQKLASSLLHIYVRGICMHTAKWIRVEGFSFLPKKTGFRLKHSKPSIPSSFKFYWNLSERLL